ncbi:phage tail assembly chaperone [Pseudoalteromonas sp. MMG013]|uniref:tail fiber assembly protein n=1 Tax=Pseudoalteromonas sp. MMG013 TaxID=2822687 RepID=UPI001B35E20F|nr:tail fiber assembly protein [Pseudoalteromonas sp. MMG013]MBQ4864598.1 phage tail assembly chaperone [Pseudoalteromonas sp. MMG013]
MYTFQIGRKLYTNFSHEQLLKLVANNVLELQQANEIILNSKIDLIRQKRNELISETDWTQMPDAPFTTEKKTEFATYRQALRDITNNLDNPDEVNWPIKPTL